jgi:glucose/arabinose dehydrogenase
MPNFKVRTLARGLSHVWDVQPIDGGRMLLTERDTASLWLWTRGRLRSVAFPSDEVWVSGETGLMSLAIDPDFSRNRGLYTCQGGLTPAGHDVRVVAWRLSGGRKAVRQRTLLAGLPTSSGRHGGCRLLIERDTGALFVGTGDAAIGSNPRDLTSLGGKVLRLNRRTGAPWPGNPYATASNLAQRYVYNYGHRNIQGLAQRRDGSIWSSEHGPDRDDEVNVVTPGDDFGWDPVPGYNESVPMTDQSLPGEQVEARWSSGYPTVATSGMVWVYGARWGRLNGTLAVAALKGSRIIFMKFDREGALQWTETPPELATFGRLRSLTAAPNGDLLVTTDNASDGGTDGVLRIIPVS